MRSVSFYCVIAARKKRDLLDGFIVIHLIASYLIPDSHVSEFDLFDPTLPVAAIIVHFLFVFCLVRTLCFSGPKICACLSDKLIKLRHRISSVRRVLTSTATRPVNRMVDCCNTCRRLKRSHLPAGLAHMSLRKLSFFL